MISDKFRDIKDREFDLTCKIYGSSQIIKEAS